MEGQGAATPVKVLVLGDVQGNVEQALSRLVTTNKSKAGPFHVAFCVGNFLRAKGEGEASDLSELNDYAEGKKEAPLPVFFLDQPVGGENSQQSFGNITRLAGHGVLEVQGLKVAFYSPVQQESDAMDEDVESWAADPVYKNVDILLSVNWPSGILQNIAPQDFPKLPGQEGAEEKDFGTNFVALASIGCKRTAEVAKRMCPRYHFAGGAAAGIFYERPPYRNPTCDYVTRFLSLAPLSNPHKQRFLYAANLTPITRMDSETLLKQPPNTTHSPFEVVTNQAKNRPAPHEQQQSGRYNEPPQKRHQSGHPGSDRGSARGGRGGRGGGRGGRGGGQQPPRNDRCWFCLKTPDVEKHLIVSVGGEVYMTTAKGPLVQEHLIIIPIDHLSSSASLPESVCNEIEQYKESLRKYFKSKNQAVIFFEQFLNPSFHLNIAAIPVPIQDVDKVKQEFEKASDAHRFTWEHVSPTQHMKEIVQEDETYVTVDLPVVPCERLLHRLAAQRVPVQMGRQVLARVLGVEERMDWKACTQSKEEETADAAAFKKSFKPFDWSLQ